MTTTLMKSNEKEEIGIVKSMKDVTVEEVHLFLSKYISDSKLSAVHQVPKELRVALGQVLKIPLNQSLVNYYKDSIGTNQLFIQDLRRYITSTRDFDVVSVIKTHKLSATDEFSQKKIYEMLAKCNQEMLIFDNQITAENSLQLKKAVLNNIGPQSFRNYIDNKFADLIHSEYCSIEKMISYIESGIKDYSHYIRVSKEITLATGRGLSVSAVSTLSSPPSPPVSVVVDTKDGGDKKEEKINPCWNCKKIKLNLVQNYVAFIIKIVRINIPVCLMIARKKERQKLVKMKRLMLFV
jgi:hypothetical protein